MKIIKSIIVAYDLNGGIGIKNTLPWKIKQDLRNFKKITDGNCIIMGSNTFKSIGNTPLKNRHNIVLSSKTIDNTIGEILSKSYYDNGHFWANTMKIAIKEAEEWSIKNSKEELFIIGGDNIYKQTLDMCDRIYLTLINTRINADVWFSYPNDKWTEISSNYFNKNDENEYDGWFKVLEKKCN